MKTGLPPGFPSSRREVRAALDRRALPPSAFRRDAWIGDRSRCLNRVGLLLADWGPVFAEFGYHLASRVDLLPSCEGFALAAGSAPAPELVAEAGVLEAPLPRALRPAIRGWCERPTSISPQFQDHRAQLEDGTPVVVRLQRADLATPRGTDTLLKEVVLGLRRSGLLEEDAADRISVGDFLAQLQGDLALAEQARNLDALSKVAGQMGCLEVPAVLGDLSAAQWLTRTNPATVPRRSPEDAEAWVDLAAIWLRLALGGAPFPTDTRCLEAVAGGFVLSGPTSFGVLSSDARKDLWEYLRAVAAAEPDLAASVLLRHQLRAGRGARWEELNIRLRQTAPFRESGWTARGDQLAEHVFAHLIWARRCGFRLDGEAEHFFRGLFSLAFHARHCGSTVDPILEGLERVSWLANLAQARRFLDPMVAGQALEGQLMALASLPQKVDSLLGSLARPRPSPVNPPRRRVSAAAAWMLALPILAALVFALGGLRWPSGPAQPPRPLLVAASAWVLGALTFQLARSLRS